MKARLFGSPDRRLFSYDHAPRGIASTAALICAPCGPEYQYAHRALRVLAKRLADRGVYASRFDYTGTGDSAGDTTDARMARWVADTIEAAAELRRMSGVRQIDMIGLRIGAAVAARATAQDSVRRLVLWDPVLDGSKWVTDVGAPHALHAANGHGRSSAVEFGSTLVSADLMAELSAVGVSDYENVAADSVLWLQTTAEPPPDPPAFRAPVERLHVPDVPAWSADTSIWSGQVPANAIRRLTEWVAA